MNIWKTQVQTQEIPDLRDSNPVKSSVNQLGEQMANSPVDKSKEFIDKGMTLITELSSEKHLKKVSKDKKEKNDSK